MKNSFSDLHRIFLHEKGASFSVPQLNSFESQFRFLSKHKLFLYLNTEDVESLSYGNRLKVLDERKREVINSVHLAYNLELVVTALNARANIVPTSIKGPVLAKTLFGDVGKRYFGDLDLVVRREDLLKVMSILKELGYFMISPKPGLTQKQWDYYFKYKKDIVLVNREKLVVIELHVGVSMHELLKTAEEELMWEDLEEVLIGGTLISTMNKDNTFLYLLYHGGWHLYFRLFWLRDVAEAMKRWDLDYQKVLDNGQRLGIDRMVGLGVTLANELFEVPIPKEYGQYLEDHKKILRKLKRICLLKIYGPEKDTFLMKLRRARYNLMLKPGLKYKWTVISSTFHRWYIRKYMGGH